MDINNLQELRVVELKKELELRGLPKSGSKKELVDRLRNVRMRTPRSSERSVAAILWGSGGGWGPDPAFSGSGWRPNVH